MRNPIARLPAADPEYQACGGQMRARAQSRRVWNMPATVASGWNLKLIVHHAEDHSLVEWASHRLGRQFPGTVAAEGVILRVCSEPSMAAVGQTDAARSQNFLRWSGKPATGEEDYEFVHCAV
jgi:hypothetical protein